MKIRNYSIKLLLFLSGFVIMTMLFAAEKGENSKEQKKMDEKYPVSKTEEQWKEELPESNYKVLREGGTEKPFTGIYTDTFDKGLYRCFACGAPLFRSDTKYNHGCGWPSFTKSVSENAIIYVPDYSYGMSRTEIKCGNCGSHLGHVFDDGPEPDGKRYCVNSASLQFLPEKEDKIMKKESSTTAIFAAGCFWGVEYKFSKEIGVISTDAGYIGGTTINPTYQTVCSNMTGHAEAVKVVFDPAKTNYEKLVRLFFAMHDPTQVNRQGPDTGTQYRTAIFYTDESQKTIAEKVKNELKSKYDKPIATEIVPAGTFYMAEEYHQEYIKKKGGDSCHM
ncbi:MAG TPA: bifunctional methionine sulfoxide reductase B/A protein [bacterium]|nr:bifunctional methionine sulfoxide reductase B/A protein [bacterium]